MFTAGNPKIVGILYFSPTNTTRRICNAIASGMGAKDPVVFNITNQDVRRELSSDSTGLQDKIDHLIIGAPVYTGKLPLPVIECLTTLRGNGKECTAVVVYGNRDYGLALYQMMKILKRNGFLVKAAGAFIGQHSYSEIIPVAVGRPDSTDLEKAYSFGEKILSANSYLSLKDIPVQKDFFSMSKSYTPEIPVFKSEKCSLCGACSKRCPVGIISPETGDFISREAMKICLGCVACVSACRKQARFTRPGIFMNLAIKFVLRKASVYRQEPLTVFPA